MADSCVASITDEAFDQEVRNNQNTVFVDFYTSRCPPCRQVAPILEQMCLEHRPGMKFVKINVEENPQTAIEHGINVVPTFALYHGGKKVGQISGAQSKSQFEKWIASSISGKA